MELQDLIAAYEAYQRDTRINGYRSMRQNEKAGWYLFCHEGDVTNTIFELLDQISDLKAEINDLEGR